MGQLPRGAAVVDAVAQLGRPVERVDQEQRALVAHRHGLVVEQPRHDHVVAPAVLDRQQDAVVVERAGLDAVALRAGCGEHVAQQRAGELARAGVPGRLRAEADLGELLEHRHVEGGAAVAVGVAQRAAQGQHHGAGRRVQRGLGGHRPGGDGQGRSNRQKTGQQPPKGGTAHGQHEGQGTARPRAAPLQGRGPRGGALVKARMLRARGRASMSGTTPMAGTSLVCATARRRGARGACPGGDRRPGRVDRRSIA